MIYFLLVLATLATSIISGVLSMAGGMILMGVFGFFLSVPAAMVLHGIAQTFSNGSRVWLYRDHIKWRVLGYYSMGAFAVLGLFTTLAFVPSIGLVFLLIGCFPLLALILPTSSKLDMTRGPVSFFSGIIVTTTQMLAGASGPVLDIFYVKSKMSKEGILGTKAVTQTLGHILKLIYYAIMMAIASDLVPAWVIPAVVAAAILGNYCASLLVTRLSDHQFRKVGRYVISFICVIYIGKGIAELI